ncbi:unnamed protein product [Amoebophrya sp. A120]|nr:unnamed protein product [Amoebophrya sp. A120]|eukprot:GSA120T00007662001.1
MMRKRRRKASKMTVLCSRRAKSFPASLRPTACATSVQGTSSRCAARGSFRTSVFSILVSGALVVTTGVLTSLPGGAQAILPVEQQEQVRSRGAQYVDTGLLVEADKNHKSDHVHDAAEILSDAEFLDKSDKNPPAAAAPSSLLRNEQKLPGRPNKLDSFFLAEPESENHAMHIHSTSGRTETQAPSRPRLTDRFRGRLSTGEGDQPRSNSNSGDGRSTWKQGGTKTVLRNYDKYRQERTPADEESGLVPVSVLTAKVEAPPRPTATAQLVSKSVVLPRSRQTSKEKDDDVALQTTQASFSSLVEKVRKIKNDTSTITSPSSPRGTGTSPHQQLFFFETGSNPPSYHCFERLEADQAYGCYGMHTDEQGCNADAKCFWDSGKAVWQACNEGSYEDQAMTTVSATCDALCTDFYKLCYNLEADQPAYQFHGLQCQYATNDACKTKLDNYKQTCGTTAGTNAVQNAANFVDGFFALCTSGGGGAGTNSGNGELQNTGPPAKQCCVKNEHSTYAEDLTQHTSCSSHADEAACTADADCLYESTPQIWFFCNQHSYDDQAQQVVADCDTKCLDFYEKCWNLQRTDLFAKTFPNQGAVCSHTDATCQQAFMSWSNACGPTATAHHIEDPQFVQDQISHCATSDAQQGSNGGQQYSGGGGGPPQENSQPTMSCYVTDEVNADHEQACGTKQDQQSCVQDAKCYWGSMPKIWYLCESGNKKASAPAETNQNCDDMCTDFFSSCLNLPKTATMQEATQPCQYSTDAGCKQKINSWKSTCGTGGTDAIANPIFVDQFHQSCVHGGGGGGGNYNSEGPPPKHCFVTDEANKSEKATCRSLQDETTCVANAACYWDVSPKVWSACHDENSSEDCRDLCKDFHVVCYGLSATALEVQAMDPANPCQFSQTACETQVSNYKNTCGTGGTPAPNSDPHFVDQHYDKCAAGGGGGGAQQGGPLEEGGGAQQGGNNSQPPAPEPEPEQMRAFEMGMQFDDGQTDIDALLDDTAFKDSIVAGLLKVFEDGGVTDLSAEQFTEVVLTVTSATTSTAATASASSLAATTGATETSKKKSTSTTKISVQFQINSTSTGQGSTLNNVWPSTPPSPSAGVAAVSPQTSAIYNTVVQGVTSQVTAASIPGVTGVVAATAVPTSTDPQYSPLGHGKAGSGGQPKATPKVFSFNAPHPMTNGKAKMQMQDGFNLGCLPGVRVYPIELDANDLVKRTDYMVTIFNQAGSSYKHPLMDVLEFKYDATHTTIKDINFVKCNETEQSAKDVPYLPMSHGTINQQTSGSSDSQAKALHVLRPDKQTVLTKLQAVAANDNHLDSATQQKIATFQELAMQAHKPANSTALRETKFGTYNLVGWYTLFTTFGGTVSWPGDPDHILLAQDPSTLDCVLAFSGQNNYETEMKQTPDGAAGQKSQNSYGSGVDLCGTGLHVHQEHAEEMVRLTTCGIPRLGALLSSCASIEVTGHGLGGAVGDFFYYCATNGVEGNREFDLIKKYLPFVRTPAALPKLQFSDHVAETVTAKSHQDMLKQCEGDKDKKPNNGNNNQNQNQVGLQPQQPPPDKCWVKLEANEAYHSTCQNKQDESACTNDVKCYFDKSPRIWQVCNQESLKKSMLQVVAVNQLCDDKCVSFYTACFDLTKMDMESDSMERECKISSEACQKQLEDWKTTCGTGGAEEVKDPDFIHDHYDTCVKGDAAAQNFCWVRRKKDWLNGQTCGQFNTDKKKCRDVEDQKCMWEPKWAVWQACNDMSEIHDKTLAAAVIGGDVDEKCWTYCKNFFSKCYPILTINAPAITEHEKCLHEETSCAEAMTEWVSECEKMPGRLSDSAKMSIQEHAVDCDYYAGSDDTLKQFCRYEPEGMCRNYCQATWMQCYFNADVDPNIHSQFIPVPKDEQAMLDSGLLYKPVPKNTWCPEYTPQCYCKLRDWAVAAGGKCVYADYDLQVHESSLASIPFTFGFAENMKENCDNFDNNGPYKLAKLKDFSQCSLSVHARNLRTAKEGEVGPGGIFYSLNMMQNFVKKMFLGSGQDKDEG